VHARRGWEGGLSSTWLVDGRWVGRGGFGGDVPLGVGGGGDGSDELWGSLPAARGNREVRVRPQFEEGGAESQLIGRRWWRRCWLQN
jgi:hypothetical protein